MGVKRNDIMDYYRNLIVEVHDKFEIKIYSDINGIYFEIKIFDSVVLDTPKLLWKDNWRMKMEMLFSINKLVVDA